MIRKTLNNISKKYFSQASSKYQGAHVDKLHESQKSVLSQQLILVNEKDEVTGSVDKLQGHRNEYIFSEQGEPHRAFSVFLFNSQNQLLLHKRSDLKMTFPLFWTNTCCSHPLYKDDEINQEDGCRLAAQRRVDFELNIKIDNLNDFKLVDKFIYRAESYEGWGEYELDYVFLVRKDLESVNPNPEEIGEFAWVSKDELQEFLNNKRETKGEKTTPWFQKIIDNKLMGWWELMEKDQIKPLENIEEFNKNIPLL